MIHILLLLVAAFAAGVLNAIAGGGSFLTFPALVFVGVPAVIANATNTVALFPGSFASAYSYRHGLARLEGISLRTMVLVSLAGGVFGAILLLITPENVFVNLTPWLLLFATVMFAFGKRLGISLKRRFHFGFAALVVSQTVIAIYGGYFGGGIGILMLAALAIFGMTDINAMNGIKTILAGTLNGIAVVVFVVAGKVVLARGADHDASGNSRGVFWCALRTKASGRRDPYVRDDHRHPHDRVFLLSRLRALTRCTAPLTSNKSP